MTDRSTMTRPTDLDEALIERARAGLLAFARNPGNYAGWLLDQAGDLRDDFSTGLLLEVVIAGEWLGEQLAALGWTPEDIQSAKFRQGQCCFGRLDPWPVTRQLLASVQGEAAAPRPASLRIEGADGTTTLVEYE